MWIQSKTDFYGWASNNMTLNNFHYGCFNCGEIRSGLEARFFSVCFKCAQYMWDVCRVYMDKPKSSQTQLIIEKVG